MESPRESQKYSAAIFVGGVTGVTPVTAFSAPSPPQECRILFYIYIYINISSGSTPPSIFHCHACHACHASHASCKNISESAKAAFSLLLRKNIAPSLGKFCYPTRPQIFPLKAENSPVYNVNISYFFFSKESDALIHYLRIWDNAMSSGRRSSRLKYAF